MMFFGGSFEVVRTNLLDGASPVISRWAPTRGLEVMACWQCLLLGVAVFFLARTQAALYFINNIGLQEHLSPTRSNGLVAMVRQIRDYARAFKMLDSDKKSNP